MTTLFLIRHGQASFGAEDYDQLSPLGEEQSRVLGEALSRRIHAEAEIFAFAGNLRRHAQTAAGCLAVLRRDHAPHVHAGLNEFDHEEVIARHDARFAGRGALQRELAGEADPMAAFQRMFEQAIARWTGGAFDGEYVESWPRFRERCWEALEEVMARTPRGSTALVFTSGGTITVLLQRLLQLDTETVLRLNWRMANASVTKLEVGARGPRVVSVNEHAHLEGGDGRLLTFR
jgi:broad specificity phosphatase PhoE